MTRKKKLRILLLFESYEKLDRIEDYENLMRTDESWFTEGHVLDTLRENGHEVHLAPIHSHPREILDWIDSVEPDLVWNLVETFHGQRYYESNIVGILELLRIPYTGCGHHSLMLCQDKALSKKILKHHRIAVPPFVVSHVNQPIRKLGRIDFPVLVKPLAEEGSVGLARDSFAENEEQALARTRFLHDRLRQDVIVEQFIFGREIYVGVLGGRRPIVFPPRELKFSKVPEGEPRFASYKAKWDAGFRERWGIYNTFADGLDEKTVRNMRSVAKRVFRLLQMRGYGRIDMRLSPEGRLFVVEANPNPEIAMYEDFSESAAKAGIDYNELIERITKIALRTRLP